MPSLPGLLLYVCVCVCVCVFVCVYMYTHNAHFADSSSQHHQIHGVPSMAFVAERLCLLRTIQREIQRKCSMSLVSVKWFRWSVHMCTYVCMNICIAFPCLLLFSTLRVLALKSAAFLSAHRFWKDSNGEIPPGLLRYKRKFGWFRTTLDAPTDMTDFNVFGCSLRCCNRCWCLLTHIHARSRNPHTYTHMHAYVHTYIMMYNHTSIVV